MQPENYENSAQYSENTGVNRETSQQCKKRFALVHTFDETWEKIRRSTADMRRFVPQAAFV